jgi:hypothetical protein
MQTRRSRSRVLAVVAVAAIATMVVLWVMIGALTYDGLELGSTTSAGPDGKLAGNVVRKPLRGGQVTEFGVTVRNSGSHAVTITGVGVVSRPDDAKVRDYQVTPAGARMAPADGTGTPDNLVPLKPFTLDPGHERYFLIRARMPACEHVGTSVDIDRFVVHFKALIFPREQTIKLGTPIEIVRGDRC